MKSVIYNANQLDVVRQQFLDAGISSDNDDNDDDALTEAVKVGVAANVGIDESDTMQLVNILRQQHNASFFKYFVLFCINI